MIVVSHGLGFVSMGWEIVLAVKFIDGCYLREKA
jgi:hypothetical protein